MKMQLMLTLALAGVGGNAQAADAHLLPIEWSPDAGFARDLTVSAASFVEVCGKLPAGARIAWAFDVSGPLDFNIHFHEGKKVVFPAKQAAMARSDGVLDVKTAQDYCWMWSNKSAQDASLKLELKRGS